MRDRGAGGIGQLVPITSEASHNAPGRCSWYGGLLLLWDRTFALSPRLKRADRRKQLELAPLLRNRGSVQISPRKCHGVHSLHQMHSLPREEKNSYCELRLPGTKDCRK